MVEISVVMPAYNSAPYIREAIDSILNQTFREFEFIIVNDDSTDNTEQIILSYTDPRIRYIKNEFNKGIAAARNIGMQHATGKYIAVMDSDDISMPHRFEIQYHYLEKYNSIDILGASLIIFTTDSQNTKHYPFESEYIKSFLFFDNAVAQPTVMMRRAFLLDNYLEYNNEINDGTEDFDIWFRAVLKGATIRNLQLSLTRYRISESQISQLSGDHLRIKRLQSRLADNLQLLDIYTAEADLQLLYSFIHGRIAIDTNIFIRLKKMFDKIENSNIAKKFFNHQYLKAVILTYRIRLIKYQFLEKKQTLKFIYFVMMLIIRKGLKSFIYFWQNEGKYIRN
jgi:glycosyltransferase involved in cell wall biosynthesis